MASEGWHVYLAAGVLPFASGTGSAVKGVVMDLVGVEEKADALSGIALVEKLGTFSLFAPWSIDEDWWRLHGAGRCRVS